MNVPLFARISLLFWLLSFPALAQDTTLKVDVLNAGLDPTPDYVDRSTPQGSVESLLDLVDDADLDAAAHLLNLNGFDAADQRLVGPRLARQLRIVLDRRAVVSWRTLLERPDALNAQQNSNAAMAGNPRRSILLGVLDNGDRETAIRLERIKAGDADPVWVFSNRTTRHIAELYAEHGPSAMERALPGFLQAKTPLGLRVWELIGVPLILAFASLGGWLTHRAFSQIRSGVDRNWSDIIVSAVRWPSVIVVATTILFSMTLQVFTVSGIVASFVTPLTLIGYVTAILIFALSVIDTVLNRIVTFDSDKLADPDNSAVRNFATLVSAGRRALIVLALLIAAGVVLLSVNAFRSLGFSLLASAGALTLVLGFAARQVLGNILASLQIALNRSARIGDQLIYEGAFCTVERIHFTFVQLKTWNGNRLIVPVSHFVSDSFENWSMEDGSMVRFAIITLAQEADVAALRSRFEKIAQADDRIDPNDRIKVMVVGQDAFGKQVRFEFPCPDPSQGWDAECETREAILKAAREIEDETAAPMLPKGGLDDMAA